MNKVLINLLRLVFIFLIVSSIGLSPNLVTAAECGDCNGDGHAGNILDQNYLKQYLFYGDSPPVDFLAADMDGYEGLTPRDYSYLVCWLSCGGPQSDCPPGNPAWQNIPDSSYMLSHTPYVQVGVTQAVVTVELHSATDLTHFYLPIDMRIENDIPQFDSVKFNYNSQFSPEEGYRVDAADGRILIWVQSNFNYILWSDSTISIDIHLTVNQDTVKRPVIINWTKFAPVQAPPNDSSFVLATGFFTLSYEPVMTCCMGRRGDFNWDGSNANILDLNFAVNYVFRNSQDPGECPLESDINGDGAVLNLLDLNELVNIVFRGGPQPQSCF